jgi:hypothetical protein
LLLEMPAGAARNALDRALDYEVKRAGSSAAVLAGPSSLAPVVTAYTIAWRCRHMA